MASNKIIWSREALNNLEEILEYLQNRWPESSVVNFRLTLFSAIDKILEFLYIGVVSEVNQRLRKLVISKQVSMFNK